MSGTGGAKRLDASRLSSFEDGDDDLTNILASRRPRSQSADTAKPPAKKAPATPTQRTAADQENSPAAAAKGGKKTAKRAARKPTTESPAAAPAATSTEAPQPSVGAPDDQAAEPAPPADAAAPATAAGKQTPGAAGAGDIRRPTVVQIPARLRAAFLAHRQDAGLTNDQVIITALEAHHQELHNDLEVGGSLFSARRSQTRREEAVWPVNVVFFEADYAVLDELVNRTGFSSRARLISAALDLYLNADHSGETS